MKQSKETNGLQAYQTINRVHSSTVKNLIESICEIYIDILLSNKEIQEYITSSWSIHFINELLAFIKSYSSDKAYVQTSYLFKTLFCFQDYNKPIFEVVTKENCLIEIILKVLTENIDVTIRMNNLLVLERLYNYHKDLSTAFSSSLILDNFKAKFTKKEGSTILDKLFESENKELSKLSVKMMTLFETSSD